MTSKVLHIATAILIFIATSRVAIIEHYCCGKSVSTSVMHMPDPCCEDDCDCCENHIKMFHLDDNFTLVSLDFDFSDCPVLLPKPAQLSHELSLIPCNSTTISIPSHPPDRATALAVSQKYRL